MSWNTNILVVADRTVDSDDLLQALCERANAGPVDVTLLAPADLGRGPTARRLARAVARLEAIDIVVEGIVGHPDPIVALHEVWEPHRFDEIVVATLAPAYSRWMRSNLPYRVERFTGVEVTHVVARFGARMPAVRV